MCNRCVEACPVGVESTLIRQQIRAKKEQPGKEFYTYSQAQEADKGYDVVYFAGCMSHLTPSIIHSMKKIFDAAGEKYWFMDEEKGLCCGRPLRQQGYIQQANELVEKNKTLIASSGAKLLVTSCPICYKSFKDEYNLDIKVIHHTEYIQQLLERGKLNLTKTDVDIVYHDPCELGRGCNIYEHPRYVLRKTGNLKVTDPEKAKALCCGGSLGSTILKYEDQVKVRDKALEVLTAPDPDIIATACPLCKKTFANGNKIKVQDIAEIVMEHLEKNRTFDNAFSKAKTKEEMIEII